jgi:hypothetical protein
MTTVYFAGGEDIDFVLTGSSLVQTTANRFRSAYARCALAAGNVNIVVNTGFVTNALLFSASNFWFGAQTSNQNIGTNSLNADIWEFFDASGIVRLRMRITTATPGGSVYTVQKVDAAGAATTLFTGTLIWNASGAAPNEAFKLDIHINYAVAGSIEMYYNRVLQGSFTGDVTTNSVTALAGFNLGGNSNTSGTSGIFWSEVMVLDVDTRSLNLQTFPPVANGNTHNFDTGTPAAANVNETVLSMATLDGSTTAAQIDEYTNGAVAAGTYAVLAFGVSALAQKGATGPSKMNLAVRTGGADFFSVDQILTTTWADYQNWWVSNPNTSADWTTAQIGSTAGFNIGVKSVT